jgi:5'-nucleotidase (lipoprotein e(P4) family)
MRALFIQGYNIAGERLSQITSTPGDGRPKAVVADIDETILDNSPFEAWQVQSGSEFTDEAWKDWTDRAEARPLPGALDFAKHAEKLGVDLFYVSNRTEEDAFGSTLENLRRFGFPYADSAHIILKTTTSSKQERRDKIMENYDIVLLIGDNLADLDSVFERRSRSYGFGDVDDKAADFGNRFIVLPNPMYGSWVNPAIIQDEKLTLRERLRKSLQSYK